jgi:hypothetical protein
MADEVKAGGFTPGPSGLNRWHVRRAKGKASRALFDPADTHISTIRPIRGNAAGATAAMANHIADAMNRADEDAAAPDMAAEIERLRTVQAELVATLMSLAGPEIDESPNDYAPEWRAARAAIARATTSGDRA